jgi:hypothetical protein
MINVGEYNPPQCDFNRITITLTVTSAGRQFDRLALMYLDDIEVFRTSTAEPTASGIIWEYTKDMSAYSSLFTSSHKLIFDLGNLVDDTYTGVWNTTLTATFFTSHNTINPADIILPISTRKSATNQSSAFVVPDSKAIENLNIPRNAKKAVFSISACGQAAEEFWWSNVLNSDTRVFGNDTALYGHSPFRELQLLIDGNMAGVAWPFPVIFTGGIVPGFWRPIVGIDAFDLREDEIDISPFIPLLSDGNPHRFEIRVVGIDDDGQGNGNLTEQIESNWVVTGKVFVWLDSGSNVTTGTLPTIHVPAPTLQLQSTTQRNSNGSTNALDYSIKVSRQIYIESTIELSGGQRVLSWKQDLAFSNSGTLSNKGNDQIVHQTTSGTCSSSSGYSRTFEYPMWVASSYNAPSGGNVTISGKMGRGKNVQQLGDLSFLNDWRTFDFNHLPPTSHALSFSGSKTRNWQNGTASYLSVPAQKKSYGAGSTEQLLTLYGTTQKPVAMVQDGTYGAAMVEHEDAELYQRHVIAANDSVVYDEESFGDGDIQRSLPKMLSQAAPAPSLPEFANTGVRALLGRGPYH